MANYTGVGRSNYVLVDDIEALRKALEPFSVRIVEKDGKFAILDDNADESGWPSVAYDADTAEEIEFSVKNLIMPHVREGEVLIVMEAGFEAQRYVSGWAQAWVRRGKTVQQTHLTLDDIFDKAAAEFGVPKKQIGEATH